jgi:hypothetical protein
MSSNGVWRNPADSRCNRKKVYRTIRQAEVVAQRQSLQQNELLIAYECFDCGSFHVGHADLSQQIVRQQQEDRSVNIYCPRCQALVPERRRVLAAKSGTRTAYCTKKCKDKADKARQRKKSVPEEGERVATLSAPPTA